MHDESVLVDALRRAETIGNRLLQQDAMQGAMKTYQDELAALSTLLCMKSAMGDPKRFPEMIHDIVINAFLLGINAANKKGLES